MAGKASAIALLASCVGLSVFLQGCFNLLSDIDANQCALASGGAIMVKQKPQNKSLTKLKKLTRNGCPMLYVPSKVTLKESRTVRNSLEGRTVSNSQCPGVSSKQATDDLNGLDYKPLQVRAVLYVPRPIGKGLSTDLYTDTFYALHRRDLYIIAKILKANTIRLAPWNVEKDHSYFLDLCEMFGLFVIPTFDLHYFYREKEYRDAAYSNLRGAILTAFQKFIRKVRYDEPILMWSVNYGLYLNETIPAGWRSRKTVKLEEYVSIIRGLRSMHAKYEWSKAEQHKDAYVRPLAIPLLLDTRVDPEDVGWYQAILESDWATWPDKSSDIPPVILPQLRVTDEDNSTVKLAKKESFAALKKAGLFDVWIAQTMPQTNDKGLIDTVRSIAFFNDSKTVAKDVSLYPDCSDKYKCEPAPTSKAVILQYGFSALVESIGTSNTESRRDNKLDVDLQQSSLLRVWEAVDKKTSRLFNGSNAANLSVDGTLPMRDALKYSCVSGVVIDEWVDDWDRCASVGFEEKNYIQTKGGMCDEVKPGYLVHQEWFGINSQYSTFGSHCIEPRFYRKYRHMEGYLRAEDFGFRFERSYNESDWNDVHNCRMLLPGYVKGTTLSFAFLCVTLFFFGSCCLGARWCKKSNKDKKIIIPKDKDDDPAQQTPDSDLEASVETDDLTLDGLTVEGSTKIRLIADTGKGKKFKSENEVKAHLRLHLRIQDAKLRDQLVAEINAVRALDAQEDGEPESSAEVRGLQNIHDRVMEGYKAWAKHSKLGRQCEQKTTIKDPDCTGLQDMWGKGNEDTKLLWTEALLLRLIESLAEHLLHSPEYLDFFYHSVRFKYNGNIFKGKGTVDAKDEFTINYKVLHLPLVEMTKKSDPYHGAINFDDINDVGTNGTCRSGKTNGGDEETGRSKFVTPLPESEDAWQTKTYRESQGIWVVLDIIGNFLPVLTLKLWLLMLAWYCYLGEDNRNYYNGRGDWTTLYWWFPLPKFYRAKFVQVACIIDSHVWFVLEFLLFCHGLCQGRYRWTNNCWWLIRRFSSLAITGGGAAFMWMYYYMPELDDTERVEETADKPYTEEEFFVLAFAGLYFIIRVVVFFLLTRSCGVQFLPGKAESSRTGICLSRAECRRFGAWAVMLSITFLLEVYLICPLAGGFDIRSFCGELCALRTTRGTFLGIGRVGSDCIACGSAIIMAQGLVLLTGFFDIYYIFYVGTAAIGYIMGVQRGLQLIVSETNASLNFTAGGGGAEKQTHSEAMKDFFGDRWRKAWCRVVEALYEDCLINEAGMSKLLEAACTQPSDDDHDGKWIAVSTKKFEKETWHDTSKRPADLPLKDFSPECNERVTFFINSVRELVKNSNKKKAQINMQKDDAKGEERKQELRIEGDCIEDCERLLETGPDKIGWIPPLSQVIPVYGETIIIPLQQLLASDGINTNLAFIISQYPLEWKNFCEKKKIKEALDKVFGDKFTEPIARMYQFAVNKEGRLATAPKETIVELEMEIRMWASLRSQTVARTVEGAIQYHKVLFDLCFEEDKDAEQKLKKVAQCVELVIAHQTYGSKKAPPGAADDLRHLMKKYSQYPVFLVCDYEHETAKPDMQEKVTQFISGQCSELKLSLSDAEKLDLIKYASVRMKYSKDNFVVVEVLPRQHPLRVGVGAFMTQGKAANQLGALRFCRGHFLQMMDCNMGAFYGEATKVPFILRRFQPQGTKKAREVQARIIGFREAIFTGAHGRVGKTMASAEWSFGTVCQRFLHFMDIRMHYGHPDFIDGFWATNRGSLSKASPAINLSEDIFAGFNVSMRGEKSFHSDHLSWDKGRESSFNSAALFFTKVSKGNVGVMRSRDTKLMAENQNLTQNWSFYFASIAFYLNNLLIDKSVMVFVLLYVLLTLSGKTLEDLGDLQSMLAIEWGFSLGIVSMFPRLFELILEYGSVAGLITFSTSIVSCMLIFTFINKSIAAGVGETMVTGEAEYIATGRPDPNTHYSWHECYVIHVKSHFYSALKVFLSYLLYKMITLNLNEGSLPMVLIMGSCLMWIIAPIIYCPQPTFETIWKDMKEYQSFVIDIPNVIARGTDEQPIIELVDAKKSLYEYWLSDELKAKRSGKFGQFMVMFMTIVKFFLLVSVFYASMMDNIWNMCVLLVFHWAFVTLQYQVELLERSTLIQLIELLMWIIMPPICSQEETYLNILITFVVLIMGLQVLSEVLKTIAFMCFRPNKHAYDTAKAEPAYLPKECLDEDMGVFRAKKKCQTIDGICDENEGIFFRKKVYLGEKLAGYSSESILNWGSNKCFKGETVNVNGKDWLKVQLPAEDKTKQGERIRAYDNFVVYLYESCLTHQLHLYCALIIGVFFLVTQFICALLDSCCGLHTRYVLNGELTRERNLRVFSSLQRKGYTPRNNDEQAAPAVQQSLSRIEQQLTTVEPLLKGTAAAAKARETFDVERLPPPPRELNIRS